MITSDEAPPVIREWRCSQCDRLLYKTRGPSVLLLEAGHMNVRPIVCTVGNLRFVLCSRECLMRGLAEMPEEQSGYPLW